MGVDRKFMADVLDVLLNIEYLSGADELTTMGFIRDGEYIGFLRDPETGEWEIEA